METALENTQSNEAETERIEPGRESFSGRLLGDALFKEFNLSAQVVEGEIHHSGTFKDCLGDYAYMIAKRHKMDAQRAENIIRDLYKERVGETMNQTREGLMKREEALTDDERAMGYEHAVRIGERVERGDKIAFSRAYSTEAGAMAANLGITQIAARKIMAQEFEAAENTQLRDWGKELDAQYFQPQIEAEKAERAQSRGQNHSQGRGHGGDRDSGQSQSHITGRKVRSGGSNQDQQSNANAGWDHADAMAEGREQPPRSAVPRAGSRDGKSAPRRATRGPSAPTRSGP